MTDDGTGSDEEPSRGDDAEPSPDTPAAEEPTDSQSESDRDASKPDRPEQPSEPPGSDDATGSDRAHPWAPYDRDETDRAAEFDAPTRDVRRGLDYDATARHEDPEKLREELEALEQRLDEFESDVDRRTLPRDEVEHDLRRYVRRRLWRGHARGWGPYLVLLYGTVMTLGAFVELEGAYAIAAMIILWLSTLGLYVFMIVVGIGIDVFRLPWKLRDRLSDWRSS